MERTSRRKDLPLTLSLRISKEDSVSGSMTAGPYTGTITGGSYDAAGGELTLSLEVDTGEGV